MKNKFYKKGDQLFVILGNTVVKCKLMQNEQPNDKRLQLLFNETKIYKQKSYCFSSEIEALDDLKERLEKSLTIINSKISTIIKNKNDQ